MTLSASYGEGRWRRCGTRQAAHCALSRLCTPPLRIPHPHWAGAAARARLRVVRCLASARCRGPTSPEPPSTTCKRAHSCSVTPFASGPLSAVHSVGAASRARLRFACCAPLYLHHSVVSSRASHAVRAALCVLSKTHSPCHHHAGRCWPRTARAAVSTEPRMRAEPGPSRSGGVCSSAPCACVAFATPPCTGPPLCSLTREPQTLVSFLFLSLLESRLPSGASS